MKFESYSPSEPLKPFIKELIVQETANEQIYKVLPSTSLVMGFQYKGKLAYVENQTEKSLATAGITGLTDSFRLFKNSENVGSVLVVFKEAGAAAFFEESIHEIFGESLSLDNFMFRSDLNLLEEQLAEATNDWQRVKIVEQLLLSRLHNRQPDLLVSAALGLIHQAKGNIRITDLTEKLNISQSPLEKRFRKVVGTSPKKFASIVRFRHILTQNLSGKTLTEISYEAGYFDQAHFIKDFKTFAGETPEHFFKSLTLH